MLTASYALMVCTGTSCSECEWFLSGWAVWASNICWLCLTLLQWCLHMVLLAKHEFFKNNFILYFIFQYWFYCGLKYGIELHSTARFRFPSSKAVNCYPWLKIECQLCCTGSFSIHISPTFNIITVDQTLMAPIQFQSLLGYLVLP